jgi:hypothetical protein
MADIQQKVTTEVTSGRNQIDIFSDYVDTFLYQNLRELKIINITADRWLPMQENVKLLSRMGSMQWNDRYAAWLVLTEKLHWK